jgi:hypothetical protein
MHTTATTRRPHRASTLAEQRTYAHLDHLKGPHAPGGAAEQHAPFVPFSHCENTDLLLAIEANLTVAEIALELGRTQHDVVVRISQLASERRRQAVA